MIKILLSFLFLLHLNGLAQKLPFSSGQVINARTNGNTKKKFEAGIAIQNLFNPLERDAIRYGKPA